MMKDLEDLFNYTKNFIAAMEMMPEDVQIYTEVEITKIKELYTETMDWKNETAKAEAALKPYEDPVLRPDELKQKIIALNREFQYLVNKAKTAKPKKPKKAKDEKKANDTTTIPPVDKTETPEEEDSTTTDEPSDDVAPPPTPEETTEETTQDDATEAPEAQESAPPKSEGETEHHDEENHEEL